ncbi:hypothetical protein [Burkholderia sp. Bp9142]|uniref:hypothetical protein n=1 Tax=Burkholderia sp. Bp9142 TaxID=2184573 RepID=UPI000F59B1BA|nr:hypothetical protein [Burkholderia sp. Bp9142]
MNTITLTNGAFKGRLETYLHDRIRVTAIDLLREVAELDSREWSIEAQARLAKAMEQLGWLRQPSADSPESYFYAAPGYADPLPGEKRFRQCASCTGYFGRYPFGRDITPCPCGECLPDDGFPSLTPEKAQQHGQVTHHFQNVPSQAHDLPKEDRSDLPTPPPLPTKSSAVGADDPHRYRNECRRDQRSEKGPPSESPFVERDSIAQPSSPPDEKP